MKLELNEVTPTNCPMEVSKLGNLIEDTFKQEAEALQRETEDNTDISNGPTQLQNNFVRHFLEELSKYSSQYKYVVHLTTVNCGKEGKECDCIGEKCNISNTVAASWNQDKDGLFNYTLKDGNTGIKYLVTVIWIFK